MDTTTRRRAANVEGRDVPHPGGSEEPAALPDGPFAAALVAAGIGAFSLGLLTTLAETNAGIRNFLNFYDPVGPLAGKTTYAIALYLVAWLLLHLAWRQRDGALRGAVTLFVVLTLLGFLGTFPIFFLLFAPE